MSTPMYFPGPRDGLDEGSVAELAQDGREIEIEVDVERARPRAPGPSPGFGCARMRLASTRRVRRGSRPQLTYAEEYAGTHLEICHGESGGLERDRGPGRSRGLGVLAESFA